MVSWRQGFLITGVIACVAEPLGWVRGWVGKFVAKVAMNEIQASSWNCPTYDALCHETIAMISRTEHQFLPEVWTPRPTSFARRRWRQQSHWLFR